VGTYYDVPPMSTIMEISEHFKDSAAKTYGEPPYGHAESSSLKMFTKRENLDLVKSIELLEAAGITVADEKELIQDIADKAKKSPQQIYEVIKPAKLAAPPQPANGAAASSVLPIAPNSGLGKKTLGDICSEYGLDTSRVIALLESRGITAAAGDKFKDIGSAHEMEPMQVYELLVEVVSESANQ
ncbi:MAG: hypothetical protein V2I35_02605, partial [Desulfocapsaceae bacterium]|nr:hypothetical protein [Desulfocapsaceae bacterium]